MWSYLDVESLAMFVYFSFIFYFILCELQVNMVEICVLTHSGKIYFFSRPKLFGNDFSGKEIRRNSS